MAWRYSAFGGWPIAISPEKQSSYRLSVDAFSRYGKLQDPPIERVEIAVDGASIAVYIQMPKSSSPSPVMISIGGLDSYKEYVAEQYGPGYIAAGLAYLALDMPGNGESSIMIDVGAERMYSRVLDYLATRKDIDPKRIGFMGVSWGGHWAARVGFTEKDRLRGSVVWGGPVDVYFSRDWQLKALGTREYLFDLFAARASVYGANSLEEFLVYGPRMSLKTAGWLGRPSAPMLLINGEKDSQVPIEDLYALLRNGSAKEAWVNPEGGHIGRNRDWPDTRIFSDVVVPWLARTLK